MVKTTLLDRYLSIEEACMNYNIVDTICLRLSDCSIRTGLGCAVICNLIRTHIHVDDTVRILSSELCDTHKCHSAR